MFGKFQKIYLYIIGFKNYSRNIIAMKIIFDNKTRGKSQKMALKNRKIFGL